MKKVTGCAACEHPTMTASVVAKTDDLPLCTQHWNWWLMRWLNADNEPPCGAHLMNEEAEDARRESTSCIQFVATGNSWIGLGESA